MSMDAVLRKLEQETPAVASLDLTFLLDNSGSMRPHVLSVERAYTRLLSEQRRGGGDDLALTVAIFSEVCGIRATAPVDEAQSLLGQGYGISMGGTALNDAIVEVVSKTSVRLETSPNPVCVVIITDGKDTSSVRSVADAFVSVTSAMAKGWKFIFVGANQDAVATAAKYGIPKENALTFAQGQIGFSRAFRALSQNLLAYRRNAGALGFTEAQRQEQRLLLDERNP